MLRFDVRRTLPGRRNGTPNEHRRENGREEDPVKRRALFLSLLCLLPLGAAQEIADRSTPELLRFGKALYERGECFSSRYLFQQVLEREPENITALSGKGQALVCEGSFDEGIGALEKVTERAPQQAEAFVQLASAYLRQYETDTEAYQGRLQDALNVLGRAEAAGADEAAVSNLRGVILYRQGELEAARNALLQATKLRGDVAKYHLDLGLVYVQLRDLEAAVKTLQRAVTLEPDSALARNQLGSAYLLQNRCDAAVFELEQAVTLAPNEAETNLNLGISLFDCENFEEARPYFEKVVALEPTAYAPAYTYLARIDLAANDFDGAVTQATKGALLPPANAEAYYWLGQAYEARGETASDGTPDGDKARVAFERALELDASYRLARDALNTP